MTKKLSNKKGFTLAELLVVVAIIAVLVAVSIPIFSAQTKKANLATNQANARAAKAAAVTSVLGGSSDKVYKYTISDGTVTTGSVAAGATAITNTDTTKFDPSTWTVTNQTELASSVYKTWYVTVDANGTVTQYNYAEAK